jgi:hypothetical protein
VAVLPRGVRDADTDALVLDQLQHDGQSCIRILHDVSHGNEAEMTDKESVTDRLIAGLRQSLDGHRAALNAAYDYKPGSKENANLRCGLEVACAELKKMSDAKRAEIESIRLLVCEIDFILRGGAGS